MGHELVIYLLVLLVVPGVIALGVFAITKYISGGKSKNKSIKAPKELNNQVTNLDLTHLPNVNDKKDKKSFKKAQKLLKQVWDVLNVIVNYYVDLNLVVKEKTISYRKYLELEKAKKKDISTINFNGSRISIDSLKRAGIKNIAALISYGSWYERITGVGKVTGEQIRRNLKIIERDIHLTTKIRISYDNQNSKVTDLIKNIAILLKVEPFSRKANELLELKDEFDLLFKKLNRTLHNPLMLFKPKELFEKAKSIYGEINSLYKEKLFNIDNELIIPFSQISNTTNEQAWNDFKNDPISFNKVIEKFDTTDGVNFEEYGLTASIAKQVKETKLDIKGFKLGLRTYQEWGSKYILCQKRTILGDEMGLGKTVQAIAAMVHLSNNNCSRFMVVCPISVLTNWCREVYKFSSLKYYRIYGDSKTYWFKKWKEDGGVAVTTYETLNSLGISSISNIDLLVVDEAHLVKNPNALRTMNVIKVINRSSRVTLLTGTVLENNVGEMVRLIRLINPTVAEKLGNFGNYSDLAAFKANIAEVYFRRKRSDVLSELPEKTEVDDWCDLNQVEFNKYKEAVLQKRFNDARRVSWNVDNANSSKLAKLKSIVDLAKEDGRKVLVFSFFLDTVKKIIDYFGSNAYGPINGSVSTEERQKIIDRFDNAPSGSVLVCQITSGGVGLNIQSASVVVICEPQFKPSTENQAISRAYRMGQARNVLVYHLLASNTVDEHLVEILERKQNEFDSYADNSLVAEQSFQIDSNMFAGIMNKEYERLSKIGDDEIKDIIVDIPEVEDKEVETPKLKRIREPLIINEDEKIFIPSPKGGVSVTRRIDMIRQPRGGYLHPSKLEVIKLKSDVVLSEYENISPSLVGTAIDYLSRYMNGASKEDAFNISLLGAARVAETYKAKIILNKLNRELDDSCIKAACQLVGYDVAFRVTPAAYKPVDFINPDKATIDNIKEMVNRSIKFFKEYGPIIKDGFTFEGGYTDTISSGDGDFMTNDTIWDFKVSKNPPSNKHTLQLLVYYLMGLHSTHQDFKNIEYIGIYNPRMNSVYRYKLNNISDDVISDIEKYVIGYRK